ncbi:MAG: hypothetical protein WC476_10645 [Phycisphaerae bacterium]
METTKIAVFKDREVRKAIHKNEWWFSITDVVVVLYNPAKNSKVEI